MGRHEFNEQKNDCLPLAEPSNKQTGSRQQPTEAIEQLNARQGVGAIPPPPPVPPDLPVSQQTFGTPGVGDLQ